MARAVPRLFSVAFAITAFALVPGSAAATAPLRFIGAPIVNHAGPVAGLTSYEVDFRTNRALPRGKVGGYARNLAAVRINGIGPTALPSWPPVATTRTGKAWCYSATITNSPLDGFEMPTLLTLPRSGQKVDVALKVSGTSTTLTSKGAITLRSSILAGERPSMKRLGCG